MHRLMPSFWSTFFRFFCAKPLLELRSRHIDGVAELLPPCVVVGHHVTSIDVVTLGLVHGVASALVTADAILRFVLGRAHHATGGLCVRGDLLLDGARNRAAMAPPADLVALVELLAHV